MLSFAYKTLGEKKVSAYSLPDFKGYKPGSEDDKALVKELWKVLDEADIVIAHNGDKFDIKKANARFMYYKLPPPSPYRTIDTLKQARKHAAFTSNKLDDLGDHLGHGRKLIHTGFHLWRGCMSGDMKAHGPVQQERCSPLGRNLPRPSALDENASERCPSLR